MGSDSNLGGSPSTSSPSAKRTRDPEEEVYLDNLRSHKRYLSEVTYIIFLISPFCRFIITSFILMFLH